VPYPKGGKPEPVQRVHVEPRPVIPDRLTADD